MTANDRRRRTAEYNLEIGDDRPNIKLMMDELERAQTAASSYYRRNADAYNLWFCRWDGQTLDGRKHGENCFPWEGAADGRLRTVEGKVNEHLIVAEFAVDQAKVQARKVRPLKDPRQGSQVTQFLQWMLYTHMQAELQRELPLALAWRFGYGASLLKIEWYQSRRLEYFEVNLPTIDEIMQAKGADPMMVFLMEAIMDPAKEEALVALIQQLSPIVTRTQARGIIKDLRETHYARIPVPDIYESRPRIVAKRPCVEVLFPPEMDDPQSPDTRWMCDRELVTETEAKDRIETENYDPGFVDQLLAHRGKAWDSVWMEQTARERGMYSGIADFSSGRTGPDGHELENMFELYHFYFRASMKGVPCLYKTIFNPAVVGRDRKNPVYASHGMFEYDHGQYPYIAMRFETLHRPLLTSRGIPEIGYTWENEIKAQADGMTDRTSLVHRPPMIVPHSRVNAITGQVIPGAILGVTRPQEIQWMPLPAADKTPIEVQRLVMERLDNFFPLFGVDLDPDKKNLYRQRVGKKVLGEWSLAIAQILKLCQQYEPDEEVTQVTGPLARPFQLSQEEIQQAHEIMATVDMRMLNEDYAEKKLALIGQAMMFNQAGTANMSGLFKLAMETIDPDAADLGIVQDDQVATEKEKNDELQALNSIMNGIEPPLPQFGNHQLRLATLIGATIQSPNQRMGQRLAQNPDSLALLQNRIKFHQNQIQQYQQNPQIGRMLSTKTFEPKMAPQAALPVQ